MNSPHSTSLEQATILANRLMVSIPIGGAMADLDPKIFLINLIELLTCYPQSIAERSVSAIKGLPSLFEWMPAIAKIRETFEAWAAEEHRRRELFERYSRPALPALGGPPRRSMRDELCERFGIRAIPPGWDAIDVTRAAAKYGDKLPAMVETILTGAAPAASKHPAARVLEECREAMLKRMGREDGDLSATPALRKIIEDKVGVRMPEGSPAEAVGAFAQGGG